jgi:hypothetical protein
MKLLFLKNEFGDSVCFGNENWADLHQVISPVPLIY